MSIKDQGRPAPRGVQRAASTPGLALGGQVVRPGERSRSEVPVGPRYNQAMISLVAVVVNGSRPGPRLWVSGAIHGDELVGFAVIRELLQKIEPEELSGTLVAFPTVNVFGVLH